jgi:carbamoyl-phosphate synthase large subunit
MDTPRADGSPRADVSSRAASTPSASPVASPASAAPAPAAKGGRKPKARAPGTAGRGRSRKAAPAPTILTTSGGGRPRVMILGGGPNRIGQGIEFDYCCVHASFALREAGYESIMVNCNPETVSTDYDISDKLYFEPLTLEGVLGIVEREQPLGVIVQFGGQTPLNLAIPLKRAGVHILGTSPDAIDRAEDRKRFALVLNKLKLRQPPNGTARSAAEAVRVAKRLGYPVLVRPSYVLGGRAMEIVYTEEDLAEYMTRAVMASPDRPILVDKFLEDAGEIDVDAVCDGERTVIAGVMEHIEEAGIHSGDSCCALPPFTLTENTIAEIEASTRAMAAELDVRGLINIQYAVRGDTVYVLEVNPRASRTVPFVAKATGIPWAGIATKVIMGQSLTELGVTGEVRPRHSSVKAPVFPWSRFPGVDPVLGPEMKSTGEVMGVDESFGLAFAKSQIAAGNPWASQGRVFLSVNNHDKRDIVAVAKRLHGLGFQLVATHGTASVLRRSGLEAEELPKVQEGARPNIIDRMKNREIAFLINTPSGRHCRPFEISIRATAVKLGIPLVTTMSGASAVVLGLEEVARGPMDVRSLQEYHEDLAAAAKTQIA